MENEKNEYFDLPKLLKRDVLETRRFAESERSSSVDSYFSMLSKILSLEPDIDRAIGKFSQIDASMDDCRALDKMIRLLEEMGCDKFILEFHALLDSYGKKGNWREAAVHAKHVREEFNRFYLQIKAARTNKKPDALSDGDLSLNDFLRYLDDEEANRKLVILAVDDSPAILHSVSAVLSGDYKVYTLTKPMELEKVLQKLTPDLFLLDYRMPEINGFELVPIIRGFEEHKDTPIIFLTSERTIDNVTAAIALGASDFAAKPFEPDILREKIAKHIARKKAF